MKMANSVSTPLAIAIVAISNFVINAASPGDVNWKRINVPISGSPALASNGQIIIGGQDGNIYAINPAGTTAWQVTLHADWIVSSPSISSSGNIYVCIGDKADPAVNGQLVALNSSGSVLWRYPSVTPSVPAYSTPTIGSDGTIYFGANDNKVYAINSNGTLKWSFTTGNIVGSSPALSCDGVLYVGGFDKKLYALDASSGALNWQFSVGFPIASSPAIGLDGNIYVGNIGFPAETGHIAGEVIAVPSTGPINVTVGNPNGEALWRFADPLFGYFDSSPTIGPDGTVYCGTDWTGTLFALDPRTGKAKWSNQVNPAFISPSEFNSLEAAPAIDTQGNLYIGSRDGNVYCISSSGSTLWHTPLTEINNSSVLISADGTLYVGTLGDGVTTGGLYSMANLSTRTLAASGWPMFKRNVTHSGNQICSANSIGGVDDQFLGSSYTDRPNGTVNAMAYQPDGKLLIAGSFTTVGGFSSPYVARIGTDGHVDTTFVSGLNTVASSAGAIAVQPDGKIVVGGGVLWSGSSSTLVRLNSNGSVDYYFSVLTSNWIQAIRMQTISGVTKILVAGDFSSVNGITTYAHLVRLNLSGSIDTSFTPAPTNDRVLALLVNPDNSIFIGGMFTTVGGLSQKCVAKLTSSGSLDSSMTFGTGASTAVRSIATDASGRLYLAGDFVSINSVSSLRVARYSSISAGTIDTAFSSNLGTGPNASVYRLQLENNGSIVIVGAFTSINSVTRGRVARLLNTGVLDTSIFGSPNTGANSAIYDALITPNSVEVIVGGQYTSYNGNGNYRYLTSLFLH
jgi:uncharacterized delta-60 repeat protein